PGIAADEEQLHLVKEAIPRQGDAEGFPGAVVGGCDGPRQGLAVVAKAIRETADDLLDAVAEHLTQAEEDQRVHHGHGRTPPCACRRGVVFGLKGIGRVATGVPAQRLRSGPRGPCSSTAGNVLRASCTMRVARCTAPSSRWCPYLAAPARSATIYSSPDRL